MQDMLEMLYQEKTQHEDLEKFLASMLVCQYCADKLKGNKDIARSAFNCLHVVPTPVCISDLNLFERTLIKFAMNCMTVIRLGQISNKKRPGNELTAALKGRIAYLPVDVSANSKFTPDNLFNVDSMVLLVGGQPTKQNKVWTSTVNLNKVQSALAWLHTNNHLYKEVPVYTTEEIKQKIAEKLASGEEQRGTDDGSLLKKLDQAAKSHLYESFSIQPLSGDYPPDSIVDYQLGRVHGDSLNVFDSDLDVAAYPELFPTGVNGMKDAARKVKIGTSDFIKSRLLNRDSKFRLNISYLFHCFQVQEISSMCHSVGHMLRTVSDKNMSATAFYNRLKNKDGEVQSKMFSLMANIRGSKEYFAKLCMDIRWMIRRLGPPTLFLTCSTAEWFSEPLINYIRMINSSVPGIDKMTSAELCAIDPVNVSIHFEKKWRAIFSKLIKSKQNPIFGEVIDHFWRIEYQARGAPHVHCVLWIKDAPILGQNSIDEVKAYINSIITCSLPDPINSPTLHNLVSKFQQHKCNKYCMKSYKRNGKFFKKCRFGFPRTSNTALKMNDIIDCLAINKINHPRKRLYHLRRSYEERNVNDYNPALLLANQANIDVQYIGHLGSRLPYYITEYMTKHERSEQDNLWHDIFSSTKSLGSNAMSFLLRSVQSRQVGAVEAADRLLGHKLYSKSRQMRFADLQPVDKAKRVLKPITEIEQLMHCDPESDNIFLPHWVLDIYPDRPDSLEDCCLHEMLGWYEREKVTSANQSNQLKHFPFYLRRRKDRPYIVTHQQINPNQSDKNKETYYYYLLKLFKPWRSETDICIIGKSFYDTYIALKEDLPNMVQYHETTVHKSQKEQDLEDAVKERVQQMRQSENDNLDAEDENGALAGCVNDHVRNAMQDLLAAHKSTLDRYNIEEEDLSELYNQLNTDQKRVVDRVVDGVNNTSNEQIRLIISGPGGTGKSRVIHVMSHMICKKLKSSSLPVVVSAPTGLAAHSIGGSTIHRVLCLPVEHGKPADYCKLNQEQLTTMRAILKDLKLLIIDEVSMVSSITLLYIHLRLTEIMCNPALFGGVNIVFFADFLQLPPVKGNQPFIAVSYFEAKQRLGSIASLNLWESFMYDELTINMRQKSDKDYADLLANMRVGIVNEENIKLLSSRLIAQGRRATVMETCNLYQTLMASNQSPLILMPRTKSCDEINNFMLSTIGSPIHTILAIDIQDTIVEKKLLSKVENAYNKMDDDVTRTAGLEKRLQLCIGARVMLKRNKDVEAGLVNGSIGTVVGFKMTENNIEVSSIQVKFPTIESAVNINREAFSFEVLKTIYYTRKQFPLMLAFAITVHKSQGLSLPSAIIDAGTTTFGCGMTYVALSRVTTLSGVHLIELDKSKIKCDKKAITEYNRLRNLYTPHLGCITSSTGNDKTTDNKLKRPLTPTKQTAGARRKRFKKSNETCTSTEMPNTSNILTVATDGLQTETGNDISILPNNLSFQFCSIESMSEEFRSMTTARLNLPDSEDDDTSSTRTSGAAKKLKSLLYKQTQNNTIVTVFKITGDGNCLFRALSLAITGSQSHHELIRAYIVNHMSESSFRTEMEQAFSSRNGVRCTFEQHIVKMQTPGEWGTENEIFCAAHLLNCTIVCMSAYGRQFDNQHFSSHYPTPCTSTCHHECIYLVNTTGSHYDLAKVTIDDVEE